MFNGGNERRSSRKGLNIRDEEFTIGGEKMRKSIRKKLKKARKKAKKNLRKAGVKSAKTKIVQQETIMVLLAELLEKVDGE